MYYIKSYFVAALVFVLGDMLWLSVVAKNMFHKYLGNMLRASANWPAAVLFYAIYILGLLLFVIIPAKGKPAVAAGFGAVFGLVDYSAYELTNYSVIKNWPLAIVVPDILWGVALSAAAA